MTYVLENSIDTFSFKQSVFQEVDSTLNGKTVILNQVLIKENNPFNKDILAKRANAFSIHFNQVRQLRLIEEGYAVYDADFHLLDKKQDREVAQEDIDTDLQIMDGCLIDEVSITEDKAVFTLLVEDHTWRIEIEFEKGYSCSWEKFLSL